MPLHQSLADLSELAAHCQSPATARGLLAEAQDLLHNSLDHSANELELATWFSRIITDIVRSPGVASPVRLSGPVARGDALPSMTITWLGEDPQLESILGTWALLAVLRRRTWPAVPTLAWRWASAAKMRC